MKKGFTLIELLAVIVILAIIAVIAVPIVLNIIEETKESSNKRTVEMYNKAVNNAIATTMLSGNKFENGSYELNEKGNLQLGSIEVKLDISGQKPTFGRFDIIDTKIIYYEIELDGKMYTTPSTPEECFSIYEEIKEGATGIYTYSDGTINRTGELIGKVGDEIVGTPLSEHLCLYEDGIKDWSCNNLYLYENGVINEYGEETPISYTVSDKDACLSSNSALEEYEGKDKLEQICSGTYSDLEYLNGFCSAGPGCSEHIKMKISKPIKVMEPIEHLSVEYFYPISFTPDDKNMIEKISGTYSCEEKNVIIPYGITKIDDQAFRSKNIESIIIPSSVKTIGHWAFVFNNLTSIIIPNSVTSIPLENWDGHVFLMNDLRTVYVGSGLKEVSIAKMLYEGVSNINLTTIYRTSNDTKVNIFKDNCDTTDIDSYGAENLTKCNQNVTIITR